MNRLIYLACPYTHEDASIRERRFNIANRVAAKFMKAGLFVFSTISHTHPMACVGNLPKGWEYWKAYDELMLSKCDIMVVITIDGWKESVGVQAEIELAEELGIPVITWPSEVFRYDTWLNNVIIGNFWVSQDDAHLFDVMTEDEIK